MYNDCSRMEDVHLLFYVQLINIFLILGEGVELGSMFVQNA